MKRILLLTVLCVFAFFGNVKAQETIEVGASSVLSWSNPIVDFYAYSVCQQIYTAEELQGKTGAISSITFEHGSGGEYTRDIVVYMKNIDKESFELNNDWVAVSDSDIVYEGSWTIPGGLATATPVTIFFTKDFEYTGGDLLLCIYDKTGYGISSYYNQFYCYYNEAYANRTLYYVSTSSAVDMSALSSLNGTRKAFTNYIKLTLNASGETPEVPTIPAAPQNLTAAPKNASAITLTWDAVENATSYNVYFGTDKVATVTETSYVAEGLTAATNYCYTVTAVNEAGESDASAEACATTNEEGEPEQPEIPGEVVTLEIGEDKNPAVDWSYNLPAYDWAYHAISQQIYTEEELEGTKGQITSVSFKLGSYPSSVVTRKYAVYVKHTDLNAFADKDSFVSLSNSDKVFEGNLEVPNTTDSWFTITFDTPFQYNGGNIVICVYDKTGSQLSYSDLHAFYKYDVDYNAAINKFNTFEDVAYAVGNLSNASNVLTYKNYIKLTVAPNDGTDPEDPDQPIDPIVPGGLTTVEIGADQNPYFANNFYLPVYDYAKYALSQQIYTAEEFNDNLGAIKSVSFKVGNSTDAVVRNYEVYMKHTELDAFEGQYVSMTDADKVFDGEVEISGEADTWYTINFDTPFDYAGGNVVICVYDKTGTALTSNYHLYYRFDTGVNRAMYSQNNSAYDFSTLISGNVLTYVAQAKFEVEGKAIVKVEPETIDFGETMLGNYWSEAEPFKVSIKAVSTTITNIESDNAFFVLPTEIDYTANPIELEIAYNKNATTEGDVNANLIITYSEGTVEVPMTANAYIPVTPDVYELAQEVTFTDGKYTNTPNFETLHDNYLLPREVEDGNTPDAVYAFELTEESLIKANVTGAGAKLAIYDENFSGKGGPSNDNNFKGNVAVSSEFFYDFNEDYINGWTVKNYTGTNYNWQILKNDGVDGSNCIISYSFNSAVSPQIISCNNVIITEQTYNITANSKLSFDAKCMDHSAFGIDHVKVEVSKDGENYTFIEEVTPGSGVFENKVVDLGAKFAALGLGYGDYHIVLRHQESDKMNVCVDNVRLANSAKTRNSAEEIYAVSYPAGKYYLVAAAEEQFDVEIAIINPDELPLAPENVVATTIDEFSIELTWEAAQNATSYNIYRNEEFLTNVTGISYTDENLTPNTDYCYIVKGYNDIMESVASVKTCATTDKLILDFPETVIATAESTTSIKLSWSAVEKAASYNIYYGEDVLVEVADTVYVVENLTPSTEYCYRVSSVNGDIESFETSSYACAMTKDLIPAIPANVVATATSTSSISLTWDAAENAKAYNVYYGEELLKANVYITSYNIINLEYNTEYCYTVTAVNGGEESAPSEEACTKTLGEGVAEITSTINIYPNPVENQLFIETETNVEEISIYNVNGQQTTVNSQQISSTTAVVNVENLNSGFYFVKVTTENGEMVKRFVKK